MAKPTKRNGRWTVRVYDYKDEAGKDHYKRITADTKAECDALAAKYRHEGRIQPEKRALTVGDAVDQYIELCSVLSPATVDGYKKIRRNYFQKLMKVKVSDLTEQMAQQAVNDEATRMGRRGPISPKTVTNAWGLISSSLWQIARVKFEIRLPKRPRKFKDYPEPKAVMDMVAGTDIELACLLALWLSFSMSEIRGLKFSDVKDGYITINRVIVDVGTTPVEKPNAKAELRNRRHRLPPYLQHLIENADHSSEYIVPMNHRQIYGRFKTLCKKHGLDITFHDLRHLNASVMLMLNVPEKYAMERGGWKTPNVMKSVYQHTFTEERVAVDDKVDAYFEMLQDEDGDFANMTTRHDPSGFRH